jgi:hypothetical protein
MRRVARIQRQRHESDDNDRDQTTMTWIEGCGLLFVALVRSISHDSMSMYLKWSSCSSFQTIVRQVHRRLMKDSIEGRPTQCVQTPFFAAAAD